MRVAKPSSTPEPTTAKPPAEAVAPRTTGRAGAKKVARAPEPVTAPPVAVEPVLLPRAADHIIDHLIRRERVEVFFGLPGGAISPLDDSLYRREEVRVITVRHESDAVFAAAGYARMTGRIGVALVTSGPGLLNAINALASANAEGLPVLVLAGDAPRAKQGLGALQEGGIHGLDVTHLTRSVTKASAELVDAQSALTQLTGVIA